MKKHAWKLFVVLGLTTALISGGVFAGSALADAYDDQYGDAADIARASRWALDGEWGPDEDQGGWAGSNYYDNEPEPEDQGGWAGSSYDENEEGENG